MKLLAILGLFLIIHSGFWYTRAKKHYDLKSLKLESMPLDVPPIYL